MPTMGGMGAPRPGSGMASLAAVSQRILARQAVGSVALTSGVAANISCGAEEYKSGITHSVAVNADQFTIVTAGRYLVLAQALVEFTSMGGAPAVRLMTLGIGVNAVAEYASRYRMNFDSDGDQFNMDAAVVLDLAAADVLTFAVTVTFSAGTTNLITTALAVGRTAGTGVSIHRLS